MDADQLAETWNIHNRIQLYLLAAIPDEALSAVAGPKTRNVHDLFAHIHNVRLMWLKSAAPELLAGIDKIETKQISSRAALTTALASSGLAMEKLLRQSAASGRVKGFKPHVVAFLGYIISHESHHRGQITWALKLSGHPLDQKTSFGLWEWGVR
ncbi:MAG: DinB family protein [Blastocatellia bacterium]